MFSYNEIIVWTIILLAISCLAFYGSTTTSIKERFYVIKPGYICANTYFDGTNNKKSPLVPGFISDFFDATGSRKLPPSICEAKCAATPGCTTFSTRMGDYGGCTLCNSSANSSTFSNKGGDNAYNTYSIEAPPPPPPPPNFTCSDSNVTCPTNYTPANSNKICGTDCMAPRSAAGDGTELANFCGCKCYLGSGNIEGQPRCLPINSNTGHGRVPNSSLQGYNADMNCGSCNPRSTEESCARDQVNCYWGIPSKIPLAHTCSTPGAGIFACTTSTCCDDNPTCATAESTCKANQHIGNPAQVCTGSICGVDDNCCVDNPTCSTFADTCKNNNQILKGSSIQCSAKGCSTETCCEAKGKCTDLTPGCQPGVATNIPNYATQTCDTNPCSTSDCCISNPQCSTDFPCSPGYTYDSAKTGATCKGGQCGNDDCCALNQSCPVWLSSNSCGGGEEPKNPAPSEPCQNATCQNNECCNNNPTCAHAQFNCESSYYTDNLPISEPLWSKQACAGTTCTAKDCCISSLTGKLPKVQMYPLSF